MSALQQGVAGARQVRPLLCCIAGLRGPRATPCGPWGGTTAHRRLPPTANPPLGQAVGAALAVLRLCARAAQLIEGKQLYKAFKVRGEGAGCQQVQLCVRLQFAALVGSALVHTKHV